MNEKPKIGAYVLETLTTGMYLNPYDSIREYIQNSTDSILQAIKEEIIEENQGIIEIIVDKKLRRLTIKDNGVGISPDNINDTLINIGMSKKEFSTDAGFRGIGRLAGIAYCNTVEYHTSAIGSSVSSTISIDCRMIKDAIRPSMRQTNELISVLSEATKVSQKQLSSDQHFFIVELQDVIHDELLDWESLEEYLQQIAPVQFDFHSFLHAPKISKWIEVNKLQNPEVVIKLSDVNSQSEREIFKPYKNNYVTKRQRQQNYRFRIEDVCFYPEIIEHETPFWLWYGKSELLGQISNDKCAGFRLRMKNIGIGDKTSTDELFRNGQDSRFNSYFIGEIHILSDKIIPNARRDGFEDTKEWQDIKKIISEFMDDRGREIRELSKRRNTPFGKAISITENIIEKGIEKQENGFISNEDKTIFKSEIQDNILLLEEISGNLNDDEPRKTIVGEKIAKLEELSEKIVDAPFLTQKISTSLSKAQKKIINEILVEIKNVLDEDDFEKAKQAIIKKYGGIKKWD